MKAAHKPLSASQLRKVAVEASADPRTVRRVLAGDGTESMAADRVRAVLRRMGMLPEALAKGGGR